MMEEWMLFAALCFIGGFITGHHRGRAKKVRDAEKKYVERLMVPEIRLKPEVSATVKACQKDMDVIRAIANAESSTRTEVRARVAAIRVHLEGVEETLKNKDTLL